MTIWRRYSFTLGFLVVVALFFGISAWVCAGIDLAGGSIRWHVVPKQILLTLYFGLPVFLIVDLFRS